MKKNLSKASNINNILTQNTSGQIGKQLVLKDHKGKTLPAKYATEAK
jgi:hypothetical protein